MPQTQSQKDWYEANKERILLKAKQYREQNAVKIKEYRRAIPVEKKLEYRQTQRLKSQEHSDYMKIYRIKNKETIRAKEAEYRKERNKTDIIYKLAGRIRKRIIRAVESSAKAGSAVGDLGCSIEFLKQYLEAKFLPGMTWDNWGVKGWHIDHILPLSSFDLTNPVAFKKACHYTNLQPLWALDNLRKSNK